MIYLQRLADNWLIFLLCALASTAALGIYGFKSVRNGNFPSMKLAVTLWAGAVGTGLFALIGCITALIQYIKA